MPIDLKLFRFSHKNTADVLYLYSLRSDEEYLRVQFENQDHGGIGFDDYHKLYTEGAVERITSIDQVPDDPDHRNYLPYHSYEIENNVFELSVEEFCNPPEIYK